MYNIPAVIFAGGKSSRMGTDKALLPFGEYRTLSEFQHHRLTLLFEEVYLSAKTDKFDFNCQVIRDKGEESSPLVALISILETLDVEEIFILSVDTPLVDKNVIETLLQKGKEYLRADAIIAQGPRGLQPLCGIYRRSILPLAKKHLAAQNHRLTSLLEASKLNLVPFKEHEPFTNLNTQEEYQALLSS